jgi:hypothetical protein
METGGRNEAALTGCQEIVRSCGWAFGGVVDGWVYKSVETVLVAR